MGRNAVAYPLLCSVVDMIWLGRLSHLPGLCRLTMCLRLFKYIRCMCPDWMLRLLRIIYLDPHVWNKDGSCSNMLALLYAHPHWYFEGLGTWLVSPPSRHFWFWYPSYPGQALVRHVNNAVSFCLKHEGTCIVYIYIYIYKIHTTQGSFLSCASDMFPIFPFPLTCQRHDKHGNILKHYQFLTIVSYCGAVISLHEQLLQGACPSHKLIYNHHEVYMMVNLKVLVRSFNCESRACYVGDPRESFFRVRESKILFRESFAKVGYYNHYM